MKRFQGLAGVCVLVMAIVFTAFFIAGCGNSDSANAPAPADPMAGGPPMPGGPPGPPGAGPPAGPGGPPMPPGMPPGPGPAAAPGGPMPPGPGGMPGAPATGQPAAAAPSASGGPGAPGKPAVPFTSMSLKSPAQRVSYKSEGITLQYFKFKYEDWDGKVCLCELPVGEAAQPRTRDEWLATFDIYKQQVAEKQNTVKPKNVDKMNDFPFVSPRPREQ